MASATCFWNAFLSGLLFALIHRVADEIWLSHINCGLLAFSGCSHFFIGLQADCGCGSHSFHGLPFVYGLSCLCWRRFAQILGVAGVLRLFARDEWGSVFSRLPGSHAHNGLHIIFGFRSHNSCGVHTIYGCVAHLKWGAAILWLFAHASGVAGADWLPGSQACHGVQLWYGCVAKF